MVTNLYFAIQFVWMKSAGVILKIKLQNGIKHIGGVQMKENLVVYEALRNHILQFQNAIISETVNMYIVYFTLFSLEFLYVWLFFVSLIVLLVFQSMINCHLWEIRKATKYIEVFFEKQRHDMHWESLHRNDVYQSAVTKSKIRNMDWYIRNNGSSFLAILSVLSFCAMSIYNHVYQNQKLQVLSILGAVGAIILCVLVIYVNRLFFRINNMGRNGKDDLSNAIQGFFQTKK